MAENETNGVALRATRLTLRHKGNAHPILQDVSFEVRTGSITFIVGPSGIGKSTIINAAIGELEPSEGSLVVLGKSMGEVRKRPAELRKVQKEIGVMYQDGALFQGLSTIDNVMFPLVEREGMRRKEAMDLARQTLRDVGLQAADEGKAPDQLSGGQRKRAGLARALVTRPRLVFCDEPTAGLDPPTAERIDDLLLERRRRLQPTPTIVVVSHDVDSIKRMANYIVFLGRVDLKPTVREHGMKDEVINSDDPEVYKFFRRNLRAELARAGEE